MSKIHSKQGQGIYKIINNKTLPVLLYYEIIMIGGSKENELIAKQLTFVLKWSDFVLTKTYVTVLYYLQ